MVQGIMWYGRIKKTVKGRARNACKLETILLLGLSSLDQSS